MAVRRNDSVKQYAENSDFSYRIGIAIPLLERIRLAFGRRNEGAKSN